MSKILRQCTDIFLQDAFPVVTQPLGAQRALRLFPLLTEAVLSRVTQALQGLLDMVPALSSFVADENNLTKDRALAASALSYPIFPFDILPDERYGALGFLDDALVSFELARELAAPSAEIKVLLAAGAESMGALLTALPDGFSQSVQSYVATARQQVASCAAQLPA
ncbi:DUF1232 domain-containing protein [Novispirillum sp. DQ9]|uniref:DUF1232 domain-containing protein n=1 Tax=Novispirillum sp. DQ9 TaxID=3398612 RepID=UPI003C7A141A